MSLTIFACFWLFFLIFLKNQENDQKLAKVCRSFLFFADLGRSESGLLQTWHVRPLLNFGPKWAEIGLDFCRVILLLQNLLKALGSCGLEPGVAGLMIACRKGCLRPSLFLQAWPDLVQNLHPEILCLTRLIWYGQGLGQAICLDITVKCASRI